MHKAVALPSRRLRRQAANAWRESGPAGDAYTGEPADLPTVGVLGGGQLGKMLAVAAVSPPAS